MANFTRRQNDLSAGRAWARSKPSTFSITKYFGRSSLTRRAKWKISVFRRSLLSRFPPTEKPWQGGAAEQNVDRAVSNAGESAKILTARHRQVKLVRFGVRKIGLVRFYVAFLAFESRDDIESGLLETRETYRRRQQKRRC